MILGSLPSGEIPRSLGNVVDASVGPRIAPQDPPSGQSSAFNNAMLSHCFEPIGRTARKSIGMHRHIGAR